jgi:hypothetical protein
VPRFGAQLLPRGRALRRLRSRRMPRQAPPVARRKRFQAFPGAPIFRTLRQPSSNREALCPELSRRHKNRGCWIQQSRVKTATRRKVAARICGSLSVISEAVWARGTPRRLPSCCGKQFASRTARLRFCCPTSTCEGMVFPGVAIRRVFSCWPPPGVALHKRSNNCRTWKRTAVGDVGAGVPLIRAGGNNRRKEEKSKDPRSGGLLVFVDQTSCSSAIEIAARSGLIETENAVFPAFQELRRGRGLRSGELRTRAQARPGSRVRACHR